MLPLSGIRVVDIGTVLVGPYASQWLADLGADVIKVEPPGGDQTRFTGPAVEPGMAAMFLGLNRNKRSVVLDIATPIGREALEALIASADIFMHNIRPQKLAKLDIETDLLRSRYPRLICAEIQGFARGGRYSSRPAYDDIIQGMSGTADLIQRQSGTARYAPMALADKTCGLVAALAILAALSGRARTGLGARVEIPMYETMVSFNLVENFGEAYFKRDDAEMGYSRTLSRSRGPYATSDGPISFMPYTDRQWQAFFQHVKRPDLADDPRFVTMAGRTRNIDLLYGELAAILKTRPSREWLAFAESADVPAGPINSLNDLLDDPHLHDVGYFVETDVPGAGRVRYPAVPISFDGDRPPIHGAPRLGEQTEAILIELGLPAATVEQLTAVAMAAP